MRQGTRNGCPGQRPAPEFLGRVVETSPPVASPKELNHVQSPGLWPRGQNGTATKDFDGTVSSLAEFLHVEQPQAQISTLQIWKEGGTFKVPLVKTATVLTEGGAKGQ